MRFDNANKNLHRAYPLMHGPESLPAQALIDARITSTFGVNRVFITSFFTKGSRVSGSFSAVVNGVVTPVGSFKATAVTDGQTIKLEGSAPWFGGWIRVGLLSTLQTAGELVPLGAMLQLEPSVVVMLPRPNITSLNGLTGHVTLGQTPQVSVTTDQQNNLLLLAADGKTLASRFDKATAMDNCTTPVIRSVNGAIPNEQGEVDFVGVLPVCFGAGVSESLATVVVSTPFDNKALCGTSFVKDLLT